MASDWTTLRKSGSEPRAKRCKSHLSPRSGYRSAEYLKDKIMPEQQHGNARVMLKLFQNIARVIAEPDQCQRITKPMTEWCQANDVAAQDPEQYNSYGKKNVRAMAE